MSSVSEPEPEDTGQPTGGLLSPAYLATTVAAMALIAIVAFESLAVTTVMPTVAKELDGVGLYALAFAAPLASGVVGMVLAGIWSDRSGPTPPLLAALAALSGGLVVCGLAQSMEVLVAGRVLQGLGGGAASVVLYVVVGLVFPPRLRPAVFASFAAAWVLPALFGPFLAATVAHSFGWRWVFLGVVGLIGLALLALLPVLRTAPKPSGEPGPAPRGRLAWAVAAAVGVLGVELVGALWITGLSLLLVVAALTRLLPARTLLLDHGLPSVIATRGLMSAGFFCSEAYIVYVLGEKWGVAATTAGLSLTLVGIVWASSSQLQARLAGRVSHRRAMTVSTSVVLLGLVLLTLSIALEVPWPLAMASYVLAGAGMGFGFPRTGVSMLELSTDADRGFNSSALNAADSLGAALALAVTGVAFDAAEGTAIDPFVAVMVVAMIAMTGAVFAAVRTKPGAPVPR